MRAFELARARGVRAGEGAAFDAEELRFDQLVGQRGAVDRDEASSLRALISCRVRAKRSCRRRSRRAATPRRWWTRRGPMRS